MAKKYKIPGKLYCFDCGEYLDWTGLDSGPFLLMRCPKCKKLIGFELLEVTEHG